MRYIEFEAWDKIAEKIGYSEKHVYRIHNRILEKLDVSQYAPAIQKIVRIKKSIRPTPHLSFFTKYSHIGILRRKRC